MLEGAFNTALRASSSMTVRNVALVEFRSDDQKLRKIQIRVERSFGQIQAANRERPIAEGLNLCLFGSRPVTADVNSKDTHETGNQRGTLRTLRGRLQHTLRVVDFFAFDAC